MADEEPNERAARSFLSCATEVARLMDLGYVADVSEASRARHLAHAVRKPLLERTHLPEEFFAPLLAAAVYDPDPSFCRWFVEPAVYAFGRRRVMTALLDYLRTGTERSEQAPSGPGTAPMYRSVKTGPRFTHFADVVIPPWMSPTM